MRNTRHPTMKTQHPVQVIADCRRNVLPDYHQATRSSGNIIPEYFEITSKRSLGYKLYLRSDCAIPRTTLYRQKQRARAERLRVLRQIQTLKSSQHTTILDGESVQNHVIDPVGQFPHSHLDSEGHLEHNIVNKESHNDPKDRQLYHETATPVGQPTNEETLAAELTSENFETIEQDDCQLEGEFTSDFQSSSSAHERIVGNILCPCTNVTDSDIVLMCLALGLRHSLTWEAQLDVLRLINAIYGCNKISTTKYSYLKRFQDSKSDMSYHIFCPDCGKYVTKRSGENGSVLCAVCNKSLNVASVDNFFLSVSMESQLKKLLLLPNVPDLILTYRLSRKKIHIEAMEDIYDGAEYKKHCVPGGVLSSPQNFSYTFFTDGVSVGDTTNKTMWPIYLTINELPPTERKKHVLLAGLYVGPKDPDHKVFLKPFVEEANKLSSVGFTWEYKGRSICSKVVPLICVLDSVARWQVKNFQSFLGEQACTFCYIKQTHTRKGLKYVLKPTKKMKFRTYESTLMDLVEVKKRENEAEKYQTYRGVKGVSCVMSMNYFNFGAGFIVEYMHAVTIGVIKSHTNLLLSPAFKKFWIDLDAEDLGMEHLQAAIDERLQMIKPPTCISRTPRPITKRALWRANEWRSWLLYYCIPCLAGLLKEKYLLHLAMLSKAMSILLQQSITPSNFLEANRLLKSYLFFFQKYYGEEEMLFNFHLLMHIPKNVQDWGPLWVYDAFLYESQNRFLLELRKNGHQVALQVVRKYLLFFSFPSHCERLSSSENSLDYCGDVLDRKFKMFIRCGDTLLLGLGEPWVSCPIEEECVYQFCKYTAFSCVSYSKLIHRGKRFCTSKYHEGKKNDNSYVFLTDFTAAIIRHILLVPNRRVVLLVQKVLLQLNPVLESTYVKADHIYRVESFGQLICIDPDAISKHGINMGMTSGQYLGQMSYGCCGD